MNIGDRLKLTKDIHDDGQDHHPPGYYGRKGDEVVVRKIGAGGKGGTRIYVSHDEITDTAFHVYPNEFEVIGS